ncbi:amicyanin [Rhizobium sp. Root708]|nr:amicyanin [Rhizobium sp. Root708]
MAAAFTVIRTASARAHNGTVHVTVEDLAFVPADLEVKVGDIIEWTNKDPFEHTATVEGGWEVIIQPGKSATHTVTRQDTVDYFCRYHPNMKGRIKVVS